MKKMRSCNVILTGARRNDIFLGFQLVILTGAQRTEESPLAREKESKGKFDSLNNALDCGDPATSLRYARDDRIIGLPVERDLLRKCDRLGKTGEKTFKVLKLSLKKFGLGEEC